MKKVGIVVLIVVVVLCGLSGVLVKMKAGKSAEASQAGQNATVTRGDLVQKVVETGTIDAVKSVEVKSRTDGRVAKLLVNEGDNVKQGQLIALIDPQQTQLRVNQDSANLRAVESVAGKSTIELEQRRISARGDFQQAQLKLDQLREQLKVQPRLTSAAIRQAQADLSASIQDRDRLRQSVIPNEKTSAASAKREAEANYANALSQFNRQSDLQGRGFVSTKGAEDAKLNLDVAKTRLDAANDSYNRIDSQTKLELLKADDEVRRARANLDTAQANQIQDVTKKHEYEIAILDTEKSRVALRDVEAMQRSLDQANAQVEVSRNILNESRRNLRETEIRAPMDGIISKKLVQEGELVASLSSFSSGTPIVRIEDRKSIRVMLTVNEIDVAKMAEGMATEVEVDALPGKKFAGNVKRIAPASTSIQSGTNATATAADAVVKYQVEIWLTSTDPHLRSGMSAKCTLEVLHKKNVLQLPIEFIGKDGEQKYIVMPPKKDSTAKPERIKVTTGAETGSAVEILSGANEGTVVGKPEFSGPKRKGFMQAGPDDQG